MRDEDGAAAVRIARKAIVSEVCGTDRETEYPGMPDVFRIPCGAFVTLKTFPGGHLRGCIGYPEPFLPLFEAIVQSARSACHDPRFYDLREDELNHITAEVTILSVPELITGPVPDSVETGKHGLIIEHKGRRGLLLPQVPAEWGWDAIEYLENLSMKAGLPENAWMSPDAKLYRFTGIVFSEDRPNGTAERK